MALVPLDADALVEGGREAKLAGARWQREQSRYVVGGSTTVWGRIGVALDLYDRADASQLSNKLAPYRLRWG